MKSLLTTIVFTLQHKMKNIVWTKGTSGLEGEFQSASEVDFYIDGVSKLVILFNVSGNPCICSDFEVHHTALAHSAFIITV